MKTILCINHGPPHACAYMYVNTGAPTYVQTHRQINGGTSLGLRPSPAGVGVWAGSGRLLSPDASSTACPFYSPTVSSLSHILLLLPSSPASPVADRQGDAVNMDENSTLIWEPEMERHYTETAHTPSMGAARSTGSVLVWFCVLVSVHPGWPQSRYVAKDGLEIPISLPPPRECRDHRCALPGCWG